MAEASTKTLKVALEAIRERADSALKQIQESEEQRSMRWKCKDCEYVKHLPDQFRWRPQENAPDVKALRFRQSPDLKRTQHGLKWEFTAPLCANTRVREKAMR